MSTADEAARARSRGLAEAAWAEVCEPLDRQLSPLGLRAMAPLAGAAGRRVLDLGCGAGQTSLQLAQRLGPQGAVVGVDLSPRLLAIARRRAAGIPTVRFVEDDVQTRPFEPQSFDAAYSRFGVMAFEDPVAAFQNVRRALKPDGVLAFVCWRSLAENELDRLPVLAAGLGCAVDPTPFSFERPGRIEGILGEAGFTGVTIEAHDQDVTCGDLRTTLTVVLSVGALGRILREAPGLRDAAEVAVSTALAPRAGSGDIALGAATWIVSARA